MPCIKCKNGKWKFGVLGRCQFDSKAHCERAARAIYAKKFGGEPKEHKSKLGKS